MASRVPLPLASKRLTAILASLPAIACKGLCHDQCTVILMSRLEWNRIVKALGGREPPAPTTTSCPLLTEAKRCKLYDVRPFICRIWGLTPRLRCPHGCEPERWLSDDDAQAMIEEIKSLNNSEHMYCTHSRATIENLIP